MSFSLPNWLVENELFTRFLVANLELTAFGLIALVLLRGRFVSPRFAASIFTVVLLKPILTLAFGNPLHVGEIAIEAMQPIPVNAAPAVTSIRTESTPPMSTAPSASTPVSTLSIPPSVATSEAPPNVGNQESASESRVSATLYIQGILGIWILGALACFARLIRDRLRLGRILARSHRGNTALLTTQRRIANELGVTAPRLRVTTEIDSPAIVGVIRRTVLLPKWIAFGSTSRLVDWSLRHELMHHREGDTILLLLRDIATSLFYFHPLARWVGRALEDSLELGCDRAVAGEGARAREYAEQLLAIVERTRFASLRVRGAHAAGTRLTRRFHALLALHGAHRSHPLSAWLTRSIGLDRRGGVLALSAVLTACGGFVGLGVGGSGDSAVDSRRLEGIVVDASGRVVPGAVVSLEHLDDGAYDYANWTPKNVIDETTESDSKGRFEITVPWPKGVGRDYMLIASDSTKRHSFAFDRVAPDRAEYRLALHAATRVEGRLVDVDGNPITDARIEVESVTRSVDGSLDSLAAFLDGAVPGATPPRQIGCAQVKRFLPEASRSDANGRFTLVDCPRDAILQLRVQVAGFEPSSFKVAVREDIDFEAKYSRPRQPASGLMALAPVGISTYGVEFTHALKPARLLRGRVVDEAGSPVAGCVVALPGWRAPSTTTDDTGRFELDGLPMTSATVGLCLTPPASRGLVTQNFSIAASAVRLVDSGDIVLKRGVRVRGRCVDEQGRGVPGILEWHAAANNPNVVNYKSAAATHDHTTDADGNFEIVMIPGPGILLATAQNSVDRGFLPPLASDFSDSLNDQGLLTIAGGGFVFTELRNAVRLIDTTGKEWLEGVEVLFRRGRHVELDVVDSRGNPVPLLEVDGRAMELYEETVVGSRMVVSGIGGDRLRTVFLTDPRSHETKMLELGKDAPERMRVQLELPYCVRGRVLDSEGAARAGFKVESRRKSERAMHGFGGPTATCDAAGRFELFLPAGAKYELDFLLRSTDAATPDVIHFESKSGEVRELGDLKVLPSSDRDVSEG